MNQPRLTCLRVIVPTGARIENDAESLRGTPQFVSR